MAIPYMKPVSSSNVSAVGYEHSENALYVKFNNGVIYKYYDVPENEYNQLLSASSVGSYLWNNIRDAYAYRQI